jgi:hypothetical protein
MVLPQWRIDPGRRALSIFLSACVLRNTGSAVGNLTITLKDESIATLRREYSGFVTLSTSLDARFAAPTFEDFLRAKILDSALPLTEKAVENLLASGQYAWAKRTFNKEFPDVVAILMRQAGEFGFGFAARADWSTHQRTEAARAWAKSIVEEAGANPELIEPLTAQITASAQDITKLEEIMQTGAWRTCNCLRQRTREARQQVLDQRSKADAREKLGELRMVLKIGLAHGSITKQESAQIIEHLQAQKPSLFNDDHEDALTRLMRWLGRVLVAPDPR